MTMLLGVCAFAIDAGNAFVCARQLQASADAAALAGAEKLPDSTATNTANSYSSITGDNNATGNLTNVQMATGYPKLECLTTLKNQGMACMLPADANAVQVLETAQVNTIFAGIFGYHSMNISAMATASMRGSSATPYNVAIVLDSTASMGDSDSDCGGISRFQCALNGVQVLLAELDPCALSEGTCTITNGVSANSVDRVSIFTFPNMTVGTAADEYSCNSDDISVPVYSFPTVGASTYAPSGSSSATYQVTSFLSDYRTSDTATSLNTASNVAVSVGAGSKGTGCEMSAKGGDGTYYAGAIYAAQSALTAEQSANSGSQNVMIILSDGEANASADKMASTAANGTTVSTTSGVYPSTIDQCQQAIVAAQYATAQGTRVYTVAYGSEDSGCTSSSGGTDSTTVLTSIPGFTLSQLTPCYAMEHMASAEQYFFSDYNQSGSGSTCQSASQPTTNINEIFSQIAGDMTVARLIPNGTT
jgi:hypothetical protein